MADHADNEEDGDIFIYRGGRAPQHVTHVLVDESVDEIENCAFFRCERLVHVYTHDGLRKIGVRAFFKCISLRRINLKSAVEIEEEAFQYCKKLELLVDFGNKLEFIGNSAFCDCRSIKHLRLPAIVLIGESSFWGWKCLTDVELSERLEIIGADAFKHCERLQRIAMPLKRDLFEWIDGAQFDNCDQLTTVDLVGQAHKQTVASLHMESWRTEMNTDINRINQVLPNTPASEKTDEIRRWMDSVIDKLDHYKAEHCRYVKEGITLLELALWKAKLDEKEEHAAEGKPKKAKIDDDIARKDKRMTCGADVVINNVLPFLQLG